MRSCSNAPSVTQARLGQFPLFLGGDLNTDPANSATLRNHLALCEFFDAQELISQFNGEPTPMTCFAKDSSAGTRRDYVLLNPTAAAMLRGCRTQEDAGLPTHRPVIASMEVNCQIVAGEKLILPRAFPEDFRDPDDDAEEHQATCQRHATSYIHH